LTPEILKSSNNRTVFSRKGSATSESRTYNAVSFNQAQPSKPIAHLSYSKQWYMHIWYSPHVLLTFTHTANPETAPLKNNAHTQTETF